MAEHNDVILIDYLSGLLSPPGAKPYERADAEIGPYSLIESQACLQVTVGGQDLLLPLADLCGMQAICGPLIEKTATHWQAETHSDQVLLDLRRSLSLSDMPYDLRSWKGHSLKLKQIEQFVLVDSIVGPMHSTGNEQWRNFNGVRYTLIIV